MLCVRWDTPICPSCLRVTHHSCIPPPPFIHCLCKCLCRELLTLQCGSDAFSLASTAVTKHEERGGLAPPEDETSGSAREYVVIEVRGRRFLHKMVRIIVGTLVDVGRGVLAPSDMQRILDATDRQASAGERPVAFGAQQGACVLIRSFPALLF